MSIVVKTIVNKVPNMLDLSGVDILPAVRNAGLVVVNEARTRAAVDTGAMRASINAQDDSVTDTGAFVNVGPTVNYAPHQEFGTSKMKAQPFMRPAVDENEAQIGNVISETLKMVIEKRL